MVLGKLTVEGLLILGEHGLREMYPKPFAEYKERAKVEKQDWDRSYSEDVKLVDKRIDEDVPKLKPLITHIVRSVCNDLYP